MGFPAGMRSSLYRSSRCAAARRFHLMSLLPVATVRLTHKAADQLERLIVTHSLPVETWTRVAESLRVLEQFPLAGRDIAGGGGGLGAMIGPWRWLLVGYSYDEAR